MARKTHPAGMKIEVRISSKGQIVIPKDVRDALQLEAGGKLLLSRAGRQIVLEAPEAEVERPTISYEEFRRRVPKYTGPPATIEEMDAAVAQMFAERGRP